ncbi:Protein NrdI [Madurella mycetomatis]|uniref:Protein NrdI n=1 Tax=Madurella mycetomatis TaxID=100816 RepID=A0A175WF20_9PEZI|nr:Protein NrdI [Madurella mycetomatis]
MSSPQSNNAQAVPVSRYLGQEIATANLALRQQAAAASSSSQPSDTVSLAGSTTSTASHTPLLSKLGLSSKKSDKEQEQKKKDLLRAQIRMGV